jgi:hypothetical protein
MVKYFSIGVPLAVFPKSFNIKPNKKEDTLKGKIHKKERGTKKKKMFPINAKIIAKMKNGNQSIILIMRDVIS